MEAGAGPNDYPSYNDNDDTAGAGGSSWIFTEANYNAGYTSSSYTGGTWLLGSQYYLTNAQTISGNASMPTHNRQGMMIGNSGNGFAKITFLGP